MTEDEIKQVLEQHKLWIESRATAGVRANLRDAYLFKKDLSGADLRWAILSGANLVQADLSGADLRWAEVDGADLCRADLRGANVRYANLTDAIMFDGWVLCAGDDDR